MVEDYKTEKQLDAKEAKKKKIGIKYWNGRDIG